MELKELVGKHILTGVDFETIQLPEDAWEPEAQGINFVLDGKTYTAIEDPEDGYRSCMEKIFVSDKKIKNTFEAVEVVGSMKPEGDYEVNETIQFIDTKNGKLVLEVGTDNIDDYYPYFVANFTPENIHYNE